MNQKLDAYGMPMEESGQLGAIAPLPNRAAGPSRIMKTIDTIVDPGKISASISASNSKMSGIAKYGSQVMLKGVIEDWEEKTGKARFGPDYDPNLADIA